MFDPHQASKLANRAIAGHPVTVTATSIGIKDALRNSGFFGTIVPWKTQ
jgi:hypothetical protein